MNNNELINLSICLTDIPKEKIKKASNDKIYVNLFVAPRKEQDNYGNDILVGLAKTKEDREKNKKTIYCGAGKTFKFERNTQEFIESLDSLTDDDDLPY